MKMTKSYWKKKESSEKHLIAIEWKSAALKNIDQNIWHAQLRWAKIEKSST